MSDTTKQRVAILGGGAGSMTAAYYLSNTPELRARFDVTVYQMGWRLGGKGANGRRADAAQRIEEHGLHVWGGFYHNAFRTMRSAYAELGRPTGAPLATIEEAFIPAPDVFWEEQVNGDWRHWPTIVPKTSGEPGEGGELPSIAQYLQMLVGFVRDAIVTLPRESLAPPSGAPESRLQRLRDIIRGFEHIVGDAVEDSIAALVDAAHAIATTLIDDAKDGGHATVEQLLAEAWSHMRADVVNDILLNEKTRRLYVLADLGTALARGMVRDDILTKGFTVVDDQDLTDWLRANGASETALSSAPLRGFYDYFFAYDHGDPAQPRMSASMGLYHLLRLVFTYKESLFFKMGSGMGDTVFGPLHELCTRNGVRMAFFHEVLEVVPDEKTNHIAALRLRRQVDTKGNYRPLIDVNGLPSWPSLPLYNQIRDDQAEALRAGGVDLEDPWSGWTGGTDVTLTAGVDFDLVVLGIPVGAHHMICPQLIERVPEWRAMVDGLRTIQTQAMQLWWTKPTTELGVLGPLSTGTGYGHPLESWSDMSHVLDLEQWSGESRPKGVVYFCGPMLTPDNIPTGPDRAFGKQLKALARAKNLAWSQACLPHLYPSSMQGDTINWDLLAVSDGSTGPARFDAQYHRANYTPSERYVLDLPGSSRVRLNADASGFDNLLLAGDWVFTGLGGAVESAVIGGMQAAEAIGGAPLGIVGALGNPWSTLPKFTPSGS